MKSIIYIGMDVHKKTYSLCALLKETGEIIGETKIPADVSLGSLTVVSNFSLTKSLKTLIISMLLSFFIVKFVKIIVLIWANVCYNGHRR